MKISKIQFRWLLGLYLFLVILEFLPIPTPSWATYYGSGTPHNVGSEIATNSLPLLLLMLTCLLGIFGAGLIGFVGMIFLWSPSRYMFSGAIILKNLTLPFLNQMLNNTGGMTMLCEFEFFLEGVIVTLCIFGPVKELFIKKDNIQQGRCSVPTGALR